MENQGDTIRLNGISFSAGSEKFRWKFFELTGWEFSDLERISQLQKKKPSFEAQLEKPFKALWGIFPGQNEKDVKKIMGIPRVTHQDRFWKPETSLLIYDAYIGPIRFKLQLIFLKDKLHVILIEPRMPAFTDREIFDFMKGYLGEARFFRDVVPSGTDESYQALHDPNGNTLIMEHFFTLRFYFLYSEICPQVSPISIRISA